MKSLKTLLNNSLFIIVSLAVFQALIHLYTNAFASYGIFRDEFYYLACSNRLDIGYVDHPPLSIYILAVSKFVFGDSLFGLRMLPAVVSGVVVLITGLLAKRLGGKNYAVALSCIAVISTPQLMAMFTFYSMNYLDYLFWISAAYVIVLLIDNQKPSYWITLGIVLGLGLFNKIGVSWLCAGVFLGIVFTPLRSSLKTKWPYIAALIAFIIFLPYIIWNINHNFAHLEFIRNATQLKYNNITRMDFLSGLFLPYHPLNVLIWLPGLYFFFFNKEGKRYRILGIVFITAFLILLINGNSKSEYLGPAFPLLFAGGAVLLERFFNNKSNILKYSFPAVLFISGLLLAPFAMPVLPVQSYISYSKAAGIGPSGAEGKELTDLPQFYADMFGWEEMARTVSEVYQSLPDEEKKNTVIFALNYGEAASLEYYSRKYPLPAIVCPHNSYWYWGLEDFKNAKTAIVVGGDPDIHRQNCDEVIEAARVRSKYAMPYETNLPLYICRKINRPQEEIWKKSRFFI
ncbi:MAG: glycosyltransferase family 39 protein [Ignavibacteriaceae bacterium]